MSASPVVVITGASSGLGRGTALAFAKRHARLVLVARGASSLREVAAECTAHGARDVATVAGDTTDEATADRAVDTAIARHGRLDVWINDASVSSYGAFWEQSSDDFRRILDVNITGYANGSRSALRVMIPQGSGLIVNVASILGEVPQPYTAAYSMSKAAVIAFGRSVRSELSLAKSPVHVVTVLPPTLDTPFFHHAGNRTGRALQALPPVYPPTEAVDEILAAWKNPGKPERGHRVGQSAGPAAPAAAAGRGGGDRPADRTRAVHERVGRSDDRQSVFAVRPAARRDRRLGRPEQADGSPACRRSTRRRGGLRRPCRASEARLTRLPALVLQLY
ncbi:SDR family NAD(P)-dependent oxidoreductase [Leifsonia sp. 2TAF2]|uniref:SDR family NAD(P)-dependent oxidoreductase n=1 Tax=Leifsonia sp. 2TAF2 TaxID=3233009 RepID=UPI003F97EF1B